MNFFLWNIFCSMKIKENMNVLNFKEIEIRVLEETWKIDNLTDKKIWFLIFFDKIDFNPPI